MVCAYSDRFSAFPFLVIQAIFGCNPESGMKIECLLRQDKFFEKKHLKVLVVNCMATGLQTILLHGRG
jgi:hypothetical protein